MKKYKLEVEIQNKWMPLKKTYFFRFLAKMAVKGYVNRGMRVRIVSLDRLTKCVAVRDGRFSSAAERIG